MALKVYPIKAKYCALSKAKVRFLNFANQIICSKDGFLYLRDNGKILTHKYINDPAKEKIYCSSRSYYGGRASHLFNLNQFYFVFSKSPYVSDAYSLSILYFIKSKRKGAHMIEADLYDFEPVEEYYTNLSTKDLHDFLYETKDFSGKYIFDLFDGILFAKSSNEELVINKEFLNLSDDEIVAQYNLWNSFNSISTDYLEKFVEPSPKASTIDEVKEFTMLYPASLARSPIFITIKDDEIFVYEFQLIFQSKDVFTLKTIKRHISVTPAFEKKIRKSTIFPDYLKDSTL